MFAWFVKYCFLVLTKLEEHVLDPQPSPGLNILSLRLLAACTALLLLTRPLHTLHFQCEKLRAGESGP